MTCPDCKGEKHTGEVIKVIEYLGGTKATTFKPCTTRKGTGKVEDEG